MAAFNKLCRVAQSSKMLKTESQSIYSIINVWHYFYAIVTSDISSRLSSAEWSLNVHKIR